MGTSVFGVLKNLINIHNFQLFPCFLLPLLQIGMKFFTYCSFRNIYGQAQAQTPPII